MTQELVTLEHPDGRRHRTDNPSEINMLISTYGYRRVEQSSRSPRAKSAAKPASPPPAAPETPPETANS